MIHINHLVYVVLLIVFNKFVVDSIQYYIFSYYLLLLLPQKETRGVVLNQVELGLRWTLRKEDNQESVPIVELKDTQEIIVLLTLHLDDPHQPLSLCCTFNCVQ